MAENGKYRFLTMVSTAEECEYIKGIAHEDGMTLSAFLRSCVEEKLERRRPAAAERVPEVVGKAHP